MNIGTSMVSHSSSLEVYFDESYGRAGNQNIICVAGWIFSTRGARLLEKKWNEVLRQYDIPYFHTSACNHGSKPFRKLTLAQRTALQTKMIELTKQCSVKGMAVTIDVDEFQLLMPKAEIIGSPYSFAAHTLIGGVVAWVNKTNYVGEISYFFEAGDVSQKQADNIMKMAFRESELLSASRYSKHGFVEKRTCPPVQAADLLAWHWYTDCRHQAEKKSRRLDCASLLKQKHEGVHINGDKMIELGVKWFGVRYTMGNLDVSSLILGDPLDE